MRRPRLDVLIVSAALAGLAACGGSSGDSANETPEGGFNSASAPPSAPAEAPAPAPAPGEPPAADPVEASAPAPAPAAPAPEPTPIVFDTTGGTPMAFPADRSLGKLQVRAAGSTDPVAWKPLGEAKGEVVLPKAMEASLTATPEGAKDLSALAALPPATIRHIQLGGTGATDDQLAHLKGMTSLLSLRLEYTPVGDAGIAHLSGMKDLNLLSLAYTKATDAGMDVLAGLTRLETLSLIQTGVTDAGLAKLKGLVNLKRLELIKTGVSQAGVDDFKAAVPGCEVFIN